MPSHLSKDGSVTFTDGQHVAHVDTVMYCTGYLYTFPFLDNIVSTADNRCVLACLGAWPYSPAQCGSAEVQVQKPSESLQSALPLRQLVTDKATVQ